MSRAGCTIVSPNYLPFARTLAGSYVAQHPDQRFYVLLVADLEDPGPFRVDDSFTPVMLSEIGVPGLRQAAMKYDILELNTNVKPTFLKHLLAKYSLEGLVYLDPDIFVYKPLDPVFAALGEGASAVLTPHMTTPVLDGRSPSEQDLLYNGTFNLGFIGVGAGSESRRLLDWWEERCLKLGFSEGRTGLFVDQKWMNLAPGFFENVVISRDPGLNMAYWNIHERSLRAVDGGYVVESPVSAPVPLRFFHFSGISATDADLLSRNTDRYSLASRPDLQAIFRAYKAALRGHGDHPAEQLPYGFDRFSDGTAITRLARRLFAAHEDRFRLPASDHLGSPASARSALRESDPFDATGPFARFARQRRLVKGQVTGGKATWKEFNPNDRRVQAVHRLLRGALRLLGPHRYELLMRYLSHISVLRHQGVVVRERTWAADAAADPRG